MSLIYLTSCPSVGGGAVKIPGPGRDESEQESEKVARKVRKVSRKVRKVSRKVRTPRRYPRFAGPGRAAGSTRGSFFYCFAP